MATNTYVSLQTQTLASAASSVTFNSIPQGYTDLVLIVNGQITSGGNNDLTYSFNSDTTSSNYSETYLYGSGSAASSGRQSGYTWGRINSSAFSVSIMNIQNYSNTTTYKTQINRGNSSGDVIARVGLWRNTSAISNLVIGLSFATTYVAGSTFSLYGISAA